jgi:hypothetical protein
MFTVQYASGGPGRYCPGFLSRFLNLSLLPLSYDHISFIDKNLLPISLMNNSACSFVLNTLNNETAGNFFSVKFTLNIFQSLYMIIYNFCLMLQSKAIDFLITFSLILGTACFKYDGKIMMSPSVTLKYH